MHNHAFQAVLEATVQRRRREPGLRQDELAELANCPTRMVQTLENGKLLEKLRSAPMSLPTAVRAATSCQQLSDPFSKLPGGQHEDSFIQQLPIAKVYRDSCFDPLPRQHFT